MRAVLGFRPLYSIYTAFHSVPCIPFVIDGSAVLFEGSAVMLVGGANGVAQADGTDDKVFGYVKSFVTPQGHPLELVANNSTYVDGTYIQSPSGDKYTAASTNPDSAGKKIMAMVIPAFGIVCSAKESTAPGGVTAGSNLANYYLSISTSATYVATLLEETSVATTVLQYLLMPSTPGSRKAIDPTDPTNRVYCTAALTMQGVSTAETAT